MHSFQNLVEVFKSHVTTQSERGFLYVKKGGLYKELSYSVLWKDILVLVAYLEESGFCPGDRAAIMCNNRPEWVVIDMAILALGGVVVPVYPTLSDEEAAYIISNSGSSIVFVETKDHASFLSKMWGVLPTLKHAVVIDDNVPISLDNTLSYMSILEEFQGRDFEPDLSAVKGDDVASLVYTSGTTGPPKGVMLTHANFLANVMGIIEAVPLSSEDTFLSFLPLSHVFERTAGYYLMLYLGGKIYYARSIRTVGEDMLEVSPTVMISVPRLYEKIKSKVELGLSGLKKTLFYWALNLGRKCGVYGDNSPSSFQRFLVYLADILVYSKLRQKTGGRLRFFVSGGAPLGRELGDFFRGLGILIVEGYGQTESSPVIACNSPGSYKMGSVGKALSNVEIKLSEEGELLARGPSIMKGYWHLDEKTRDTIDSDGWLYTGDIAEIDLQHFITIVDRKKDLIILSNGKNIAPQRIETALMLDPYIEQVIILGEKRQYVSALIVPDFERLAEFVAKNRLQDLSVDALLKHPKVQAFYSARVNESLRMFSNYERVKHFVLMCEAFTQENGELTPTLKPKRKYISEKYHDIIHNLYT
jgi:long-chain acyl-CoA synthetase